MQWIWVSPIFGERNASRALPDSSGLIKTSPSSRLVKWPKVFIWSFWQVRYHHESWSSWYYKTSTSSSSSSSSSSCTIMITCSPSSFSYHHKKSSLHRFGWKSAAQWRIHSPCGHTALGAAAPTVEPHAYVRIMCLYEYIYIYTYIHKYILYIFRAISHCI